MKQKLETCSSFFFYRVTYALLLEEKEILGQSTAVVATNSDSDNLGQEGLVIAFKILVDPTYYTS